MSHRIVFMCAVRCFMGYYLLFSFGLRVIFSNLYVLTPADEKYTWRCLYKFQELRLKYQKCSNHFKQSNYFPFYH